VLSWLAHSVRQDTVAWLVVSSFIGGVIGSLTKFGFEDVLWPRLSSARELQAVTRKYSVPLI
jgi:uncharacterized membrane protein YagU involved in acid resistance